MKLPKKALAKTRTFETDNAWLVKRAEERHTIVAVIVHELIQGKIEYDKDPGFYDSGYASPHQKGDL